MLNEYRIIVEVKNLFKQSYIIKAYDLNGAKKQARKLAKKLDAQILQIDAL